LRLILTAGQEADVTQGAALVSAIPTGAVIADKGYDSNALIETIEDSCAHAIIDPARDRLASLQGKKPFLGSAQTFLRPALLRTPSWFDGESCSPTYYQKVILESAFCWHPTPKMNLRLNDTRLGRMIFITRRTS